MKTYFWPSVKLSLILLVIIAIVYPITLAGIGFFTKGGGDGETVQFKGRIVGFANEAQRFTDDKYFWPRPSANGYKADASGGSNKGPSNPDYLKDVKARIDYFMAHNPGVMRKDIPSEMVTASGSGLDPDISPIGAIIQAQRVAHARKIPVSDVMAKIKANTETPLFGILGPSKINVLQLNIALDQYP